MVCFHEFSDSDVDGLLNDFAWEGEQRDGSVILEVHRVARAFLQQGVYLCMFPVLMKGGELDGAVDGAAEFRGDGGGTLQLQVFLPF